MKPTAYKWKNSEGIGFLSHDNAPMLASGEPTLLYAIHDVADFIRGLYFDDNFIKGWDKSVFAEIADKIEKESKK